MIKEIRKRIYRIFCIQALVLSLCLMISLVRKNSLEIRPVLMFLLLAAVVVWGIIDWVKNSRRILMQEEELRNYQMYMQPLEEMVKEIRSNQHEFDNHLNTLLHMHLMIDSYDELVERQSSYIKALQKDSRRQLIPLLSISDKILAGFLYSKIVSMEEWINVDLEVKSSAILSGVSEHDIIEILGTLVDNAAEACTKERNHIHMELDSIDGHLIFEVENEVSNLTLSDTSRFFEKGYSSKESLENRGVGVRGFGLYNAKTICERHGGSITVALPWRGDRQYISFRLEL